ncbi:MAG: DNA-binding protein [Verrucomicrobiia bacterium]
MVEHTIRSAEVQIERKMFFLSLKENPRGRFLRITEMNAAHPAAIIIPATGLEELVKVLIGMVKADGEIPPGKDPTPV